MHWGSFPSYKAQRKWALQAQFCKPDLWTFETLLTVCLTQCNSPFPTETEVFFSELQTNLGPPWSTMVTGPTRCVTPPTRTAAVSSSLICTKACFLVLPRRHLVWAASRKLLLDTYNIGLLMRRKQGTSANRSLNSRAGQFSRLKRTYRLVRVSSNESKELPQ